MDYISTKDAALRWGVSQREVQQLIAIKRIPGVKKCGGCWLLPSDSEKPDDLRRTRKLPSGKAQKYFLLTPTVFSKRNHKIVEHEYPPQYNSLLEADLAYRRGDPKPAKDVWYSTTENDPTKLTAATIATVAAISAGDFELYNEISKTIQNKMMRTKDKQINALLSLPLTLAAVSMAVVDMTPQWLKDGDFSLFSREHIPLLLYLYELHLRNIDDKKGVLYTAKTSFALCEQTGTFTWLDVYNLTLCAQAYFDLGDKERSKEYLLLAMKLGLPAGFIAPFADYLGTLGGLVEACLEEYYPNEKAPIIKLWNHSFKNWMIFHNKYTSENITTILTLQEYQLARHIARGASYVEAARKMNLSVGRVKNILLDVYGKLHINKRSQLTSFVT